jgi:hypothetical protein
MNRVALSVIALVPCAAIVVASSASAQGRAAPVRRLAVETPVEDGVVVDSAAHAKRLSELEVWLRRLVGSYRVDGDVDQLIGADLRGSSRIKGGAVCTAVGDGPGVRCLVDATWAPIFYIQQPGYPGVEHRSSDSTPANKFTLHPSIFLFGLHPETETIRVMEVDDHSIAVEAGEVIQEDNKLEYVTTCPAIDYRAYCRHVRVTAKPGRNAVSIEIQVIGGAHFNLLWHRLSGEKEGEVSK